MAVVCNPWSVPRRPSPSSTSKSATTPATGLPRPSRTVARTVAASPGRRATLRGWPRLSRTSRAIEAAGAGKTTILRMIAGEEQPDDGTVAIPKRTTIGYFRQDVETMGGNSTLDEAIAGSGRLGVLHH